MAPKSNKSAGSPASDLTGRERMVRNVITSWAGESVFIVAGFIMPRMIDRYIDQESLGVWDFGWSLVAYFTLVQVGIVSSINRFVARHRAEGDVGGVNVVVSSVTFVLAIMGLAVFVLTVAATLALPVLLKEQLAGHIHEARWVVLLLPCSLAVQIVFSGYGGVLTGFHRWGLHNAILAGGYAVVVVGMIVVLLTGGGLRGLAAVTFLGQLGQWLVRVVAAHRVFPALRVRRCFVRWSAARELLAFGGKSFVPQVASTLLNQAVPLLILYYLGPAALALYSRPRSLVQHVLTVINRFAQVLTPTTSAFQVLNKQEELRELLVTATRYAAAISLPMIVFLTFMGAPVLAVWMGKNYPDAHWVLVVLALGNLTVVAQMPVWSMLYGLNAHGRPGFVNLVAALAAIALAFLSLGVWKQGLVWASLSVALPIALCNGVYVPLAICRKLQIPIRRYVVQAMRTPVLCVIPFGLTLFGVRMTLGHRPVSALLLSMGVGGILLTGLYWRFILSESLREKILARLRFRRAATGAPSE